MTQTPSEMPAVSVREADLEDGDQVARLFEILDADARGREDHLGSCFIEA